MNSLSWLIYLINICTNFGNFVIFIVVASVILTILLLLIAFVSKAIADECGDEPPFIFTWFMPKLKYFVTIFVVASLLNIVIPSKQTLILIAASEIGEKIIKSDKVDKTINNIIDPSITLLNTWIVKETNSLLKEEPAKKQ